MSTVTRASLLRLIIFSMVSTASAQSPSFEVASVKAVSDVQFEDRFSDPLMYSNNFHGGPGTNSPERIDYRRVTLKMLLERAYAVRPEQILGPGWVSEQRYYVAATLSRGTTPDQLRLMLQRLLAERFRVRLHRERTNLPVYHLVVAKGGPKLTPAESSPEYSDPRAQASALAEKAAAGASANRGSGMTGFQMFRANMTDFARNISSYVDRPVIDETRLGGYYSVVLKWVPNQALSTGDTTSGPSILVAVEEQLGLKLQPGKADFEMFVIDYAERTPEAN